MEPVRSGRVQSRYLPYLYTMNCNSLTLEHALTSQITTTGSICRNLSVWNTNHKFQRLNLSIEIAKWSSYRDLDWSEVDQKIGSGHEILDWFHLCTRNTCTYLENQATIFVRFTRLYGENTLVWRKCKYLVWYSGFERLLKGRSQGGGGGGAFVSDYFLPPGFLGPY